MSSKIRTAQICSVLLFPMIMSPAVAETLWSKNSLSYLKNTSDFEVLTNDSINVFTLEHTSGHNWGDVFMFMDRIDAKADKQNPEHKETYGEVSARLSLDYALGIKLPIPALSDTFVASMWEHSTVSESDFSQGFDNYLLGFGTSWQVPGFNFFNANVYASNNELVDNDVQLTVAWGYPIEFGNHKFMFDGYFDWASAADDHAADFHFNPQFRVDVGNYFGNPNTIDVGIEYSYWRNKFGIEGLDNESVVSLMVKLYL
ncbi:outer membrane protein OmpK [Thalassotalea euphylliae]|uniref:outer membrane protein OmpK n=1 Tax=Thalassotalea euphylliae TaxID=1655234 RepID=UPI00363F815C